jgi:DNA-binding NtrC family response regulator
VSQSHPGGDARPVRSILIIDDDPDVLALLDFTFRAGGTWAVHTASCVSSATSVLEGAEAIDVVLVDDHVTGGRPDELLHLAGGRPIVLLSTLLDAPPSTLVAVAGFAGGISKPFNPLTTPGLVAEAVDRRSPERHGCR